MGHDADLVRNIGRSYLWANLIFLRTAGAC